MCPFKVITLSQYEANLLDKRRRGIPKRLSFKEEAQIRREHLYIGIWENDRDVVDSSLSKFALVRERNEELLFIVGFTLSIVGMFEEGLQTLCKG